MLLLYCHVLFYSVVTLTPYNKHKYEFVKKAICTAVLHIPS